MFEIVKGVLRPLKRSYENARLPARAKRQIQIDRQGLPQIDPGAERVIEEGIGWLGRAQDNSATHDGGVARDYSLVDGWSSSYPETTGYIVPTMYAYARRSGTAQAAERARRMLDWLVSIQFADGAYQGGLVDAKPLRATSFNVGQILIGLAAGARDDADKYLDPMRKAALWLVAAQDPEGSWSKHQSPFAAPGLKTYDTHVAWGLFEAARVEPSTGFGEAGMRNVTWALSFQAPNGWFEHCCLTEPWHPLTHTLGYVLRGVLEAYRWSGDATLLAAARKTADGILGALRPDGSLPGRLDRTWRGTVDWVCLTGAAQLALCWFILYDATGERGYLEAGRLATRYVRKTVDIDGPAETRGAVRGSFPVDGDYGRLEYLNWAAKFTVDACMADAAAAGR